MKIGILPYLRFWRPLPLLWIFASLVNPAIMTCFVWGRGDSAVRFYGAHVLLPLAFGMAQALIVARAIHQPAFVLLPGVRRYFQKMYAWNALGSAVVVTLVAHLAVPAVAWTGSAGMALIFLSLGLGWEPFHRWCGSAGLMAMIVALTIAAGLLGGVVRDAVLEYPLVVFAVGLLMFPAGNVLAFKRERVRERAYSLMVLFGGNFQSLARQGMARQKQVGRNWERQPIGERSSVWRRALWHERFGVISRTRTWLIWLSMIVGYAAIATIALAIYVYSKHQAVTGATMGREFHALIWVNGAERQAMPLAPFLVATVIVVTYALSLAFPVPSFLYPGSRRLLMRLSLQVAFIRAAKISIQGSLLIVVLAWLASVLSSTPFGWKPTSLFALPLTTVPFLPLVAAAGLSLVRRPGNPAYVIFSVPGLVWMAVAVASITAAMFLSMFATAILTGGGVVGAIAATLATSAWLVHRARIIFLNSDLVVRSVV